MDKTERLPQSAPESIQSTEKKDNLARSAFGAMKFEDLPVGRLGGRLASIPETHVVPDEDYFDESNFREGPKTI